MARITIIDDDKELADNVASILRGAQHEVRILETTENAVAALVADTPEVLLLDVMFPDNPVAGFELARQIRQRPEISSMPILLLTAVNHEFPTDFSAQDIDPDWMPVQDFMEKPITAALLLQKIGELISGGG